MLLRHQRLVEVLLHVGSAELTELHFSAAEDCFIAQIFDTMEQLESIQQRTSSRRE